MFYLKMDYRYTAEGQPEGQNRNTKYAAGLQSYFFFFFFKWHINVQQQKRNQPLESQNQW